MDLYEHWKNGNRYLVISEEAYDSNNDRPGGQRCVIYLSLDPGPRQGQVNVRHATEFHEMVTMPDGSQRPRFRRIHRFRASVEQPESSK